jgi:hypothetical protein
VNKFRGQTQQQSTKCRGHSTNFWDIQQQSTAVDKILGAFNSGQQNFGGTQQQLTQHSARRSKRPFRATFRKLIVATTAKNGVHAFSPQLSGGHLAVVGRKLKSRRAKRQRTKLPGQKIGPG